MKSTARKYFRIRVTLVGLFFGLFLAVICGKAAHLQIYPRSMAVRYGGRSV